MAEIAKSSGGYPHNAVFNDIVFDNRNKEYGAYILRQLTARNAGIGLVVAASMGILIVIAGSIDWSALKPKEEEKIVETTVTLAEPPPLNENAPPPSPPPPPPPPPVRPTVKFMEMVVKKNEEVVEEEPITEIKDIQNQEIATVTQEGDADAEPIIEEPKIAEPVVEAPKIFNIVEQMPEFPGGEDKMMAFIRDNYVIPQLEKENDIQGRVIVSFVVNEDGAVSDAVVRKGVSAGLDKEALRVVKLLKFKPGKQQGKAVKVNYTLPIMIKYN